MGFLDLFFALILRLTLSLPEQYLQDSLLEEVVGGEDYETLSQSPEFLDEYLTYAMESMPGDGPGMRRTQQILTSSWKNSDPISGAAFRYRLKIKYTNHWEARLVADQDPGEKWRYYSIPHLPNHLSGGFLIRPGNHIREVIMGDYQIHSGFGAVIGSSPQLNITLGNPGYLHRPGRGIRLHSGTDEIRFLRGTALRLAHNRSEWIFFGNGKMTSIGSDTLPEMAGGALYNLRFTAFEGGVSVVGVRYDSLVVEPDDWSTDHEKACQTFIRTGAWGQCRLPFGILFGEAGWSPGKGNAWIGGFRLFDQNGFSLVARITSTSPGYPVRYTWFQTGNALTRSRTEAIASFQYARNRKVTWQGSLQSSFDSWPDGTRLFMPATRISQRMIVALPNQWRLTATCVLASTDSISGIPRELTWKLQADNNADHSHTLHLRAGIQQSLSGITDSPLSSTSADISASIRMAKENLQMTTGFRVFFSKPGGPVLYSWEPDLLYGWSAPVLSGSGSRWYLNLRWTLLPGLVIEGKVYQARYTDLKHLTDGNNGGMGVRMQVSWTRPGAATHTAYGS